MSPRQLRIRTTFVSRCSVGLRSRRPQVRILSGAPLSRPYFLKKWLSFGGFLRLRDCTCVRSHVVRNGQKPPLNTLSEHQELAVELASSWGRVVEPRVPRSKFHDVHSPPTASSVPGRWSPLRPPDTERSRRDVRLTRHQPFPRSVHATTRPLTNPVRFTTAGTSCRRVQEPPGQICLTIPTEYVLHLVVAKSRRGWLSALFRESRPSGSVLFRARWKHPWTNIIVWCLRSTMSGVPGMCCAGRARLTCTVAARAGAAGEKGAGRGGSAALRLGVRAAGAARGRYEASHPTVVGLRTRMRGRGGGVMVAGVSAAGRGIAARRGARTNAQVTKQTDSEDAEPG